MFLTASSSSEDMFSNAQSWNECVFSQSCETAIGRVGSSIRVRFAKHTVNQLRSSKDFSIMESGPASMSDLDEMRQATAQD